MEFNEYQEQAARTLRHDYATDLKTIAVLGLGLHTPNASFNTNYGLLVAALGITGEAGEVADRVKKTFEQGHKLDRDAMVQELGDVLWYVAAIATRLDVSLQDVADGNIAKLRERFKGEGFTHAESVNRTPAPRTLEEVFAEEVVADEVSDPKRLEPGVGGNWEATVKQHYPDARGYWSMHDQLYSIYRNKWAQDTRAPGLGSGLTGPEAWRDAGMRLPAGVNRIPDVRTTAAQRVKARYPEACASWSTQTPVGVTDPWEIWPNSKEHRLGRTRLGMGYTELEAWSNAALNLQ